ncbi:T9SS-dependent M36 family metallopeptidase [Hymenobacter psychrophilus]|uniref:Por secretion system C-terminal sorting domain-containing protein n=1 Tax=Hymenobacter psychrophilus TaxID=651662 RepID=A0A1H3EW54_9BACT|nr:T9SS-dependent M36 family metallopeptidase [Hymenobacter psychrophilus]SDX82860.1 Por secretion system C-terminal sorting domain-containing protein [Hymenobacter psychrophilus]
MNPTFTPAVRALAAAALLALPGLAAAQSAAPDNRALQALQSRSASFGLVAADAADAAVTKQFTDEHNGITHVYLRQRVQGIEVYGAVASVHLSASGRVASLNSSFLPNVQVLARGAAPTPGISAQQAVAAAARAVGMPAPGPLTLLRAGTPAAGMDFNDGGITSDKIPVQLMYLPMSDGSLRLVWDVTLAPRSGDHFWNARVDAASGALLDKTDLTVSEDISMLNLTQPMRAVAEAAAAPAKPAARPTATPNSYNVWPLTVESPIHGPRQFVVDPADKASSPFGWHDTNGVAGAEFTITRGNNVFAYDDPNDNGNAGGDNYSPDGGADLVFDYPFDNTLAASAKKNLNLAVTNLFYWNNLMHDVMARKGFDEASGNFQSKNYSGKGLGNDDVMAEAQDKSTTTPPAFGNANFGTPVDGMKPRMQMYLWNKSELDIKVTAPAALAGPLNALEGSLGRSLERVGPITGNLVVVNDGSAKPERGCNAPLVNAAAISGNIALIERGKCGFALKIKNAQNAGARMVIMMDSIPDATTLVRMGGSAPDSVGLRIPSVFITKNEGEKLKQAVRAGQTVTVSASGNVYYRDGDFDNGIIAHEYGHGISNRLTGGAGLNNCLTNGEQMGEGWSDFFGLWMTTKPGDVGKTGRGIGTYASFEPIDGPGIRPTRYSNDFTINSATYALVGTGAYNTTVNAAGNTVPQVHNIGYIWASTLWDLNWALIEKYGYNADLNAATGGNNIALRLVMDGLKFQPCRPGFIDGRDAIMLADKENNNGANSDLIWRVFARRGMGFSAKQGSSNVLTDQTAAFDMPTVLSSGKQLNANLLDVYPNPAREQVVIRTQVSSSAPVQVEMVSLLGQRVFTQTISAARLQQDGLTVNTSTVAPGMYLVRLTTSEGTLTKKLLVQH